MATIHIPAHWREHTEGQATVEVPGHTLGTLLDNLAERYPALHAILLDGGALRGEIAVAINAVITENGVLEPVEDTDEIFLLPAIAGGSSRPEGTPDSGGARPLPDGSLGS